MLWFEMFYWKASNSGGKRLAQGHIVVVVIHSCLCHFQLFPLVRK